jgi:hypothetical protein
MLPSSALIKITAQMMIPGFHIIATGSIWEKLKHLTIRLSVLWITVVF